MNETQPIALKADKFSLFSIFSRISDEEKISFARHLSIVIKAGLPLLGGLRIIRRQTESKALAKVIDQLIRDIENGQFMSDSLNRHSFFDPFFINMIRVGETSGTLATNLLYLAEEMKKSKDLKSKVKGALIYPIIIMIATLGVTGLLTFFVFPKVLPIFSSLHVDLPFTTRALIATLNFLLHYGWWLLGVLIALAVALRLSLKVYGIKYFFDRLMFFTPVISSLTINVNMANFTRTLGILLKSGIKIVEAITITSKTFNNSVYQRALLDAAENTRKGEQFATFLAAHRKFFPPLLAGMIEIGENTGNFEENLKYLSEYYSDEAESTLKNLTTLLEPLLLLTMGLIVGFVALSIITPIYQISQNLHA